MKRSILISISLAVLIVLITGIYFISKNFGSYNVDGVKVQIQSQGDGNESKKGDLLTLHYTGMLENGQTFDSSYDRNSPITFILGEENVIKGFDTGVTGMKVGEKRKITIPPDLGYGEIEFAGIPANSVLIYEVELLSIN